MTAYSIKGVGIVPVRRSLSEQKVKTTNDLRTSSLDVFKRVGMVRYEGLRGKPSKPVRLELFRDPHSTNG